MARIDDYVEAVTRRLRGDPELHMDVAREVRAHLEDAVEKARAAGRSEEECVAGALKAFGDPAVLSEQIWRANMRRMRLRAAGKWAGRLALVPAALVLAVVLGGYSLRVGYGILCTAIGGHGGHGDPFSWVFLRPPEPRRGLSEDETFIFEHLNEDVADARTLADRFPQDPLYHAHYVRLRSEFFVGPADELGARLSFEQIDEWLDTLERGSELEPDNALYNYLKAHLLMSLSSSLEEDESAAFTYPGAHAGPDGMQEVTGWRLVILDRPMFEDAMREVLQGAVKARCTSHAHEVASLRAALTATPTTVEEQTADIARDAAILMPHLQPMRTVALSLPPYARLLAEEGRRDEAARLAELMHRPGLQMAADAGFLLTVLVGNVCMAQTAGRAGDLLDELGRPTEAARARALFEDVIARQKAVWDREHDSDLEARVATEGGVVMAMLIPVVPGGWDRDWLRSMARAEHVAAERIVLGLLVGMMGMVVFLLGLAALGQAGVSRGGATAPRLLFIGWGRLGRVVLVSLVIPLGAYWAYTRLVPTSGMRYGINHAPVRRLIELAAVLLVPLVAMPVCAYRAVLRRCEEAGLRTPPRGYMNPLRNPWAALAAGLLCFAIGSAMGAIQVSASRVSGLGVARTGVLACLVTVLLFPAAFASWQLRHMGHVHRPARETFRRFIGRVAHGPRLVFYAPLAVALAVAALVCASGTDRPVAWAALLVFLALTLPVLLYAALRTLPTGDRDPEMLQLRGTLLRSMVPVLAVCLVLLGVVANGWLRLSEAAHLSAFNTPGMRWYEKLEMTGIAPYRDHLRDVNERWLRDRRPAANPD